MHTYSISTKKKKTKTKKQNKNKKKMSNTLTSLQAIDVLRIHTQQQVAVVQRLGKVVQVVGAVLATGVQLFGQGEKRSGVVLKIVNVENGLRVWDAVLLKIIVQPCAWSPAIEIRGKIIKFYSTESLVRIGIQCCFQCHNHHFASSSLS
jgi:hypothetical protein